MNDRIAGRIILGNQQVPVLSERERGAVLRLRKIGFTQTAVASLLGIDQTTINRVERKEQRKKLRNQ